MIENGVAGPVDEQGLEFPDLEAAESETGAVIANMIEGAAVVDGQAIEVVISDENRQPVARLKLTLARNRFS